MKIRINPYVIVFFTILVTLVWRPFLIGFYGDDYSNVAAKTLGEAFFWERRDRLLYFFPLGIPRYLFGLDPIGWGFYAITVASLTGMALYSFIKSVLDRLAGFERYAQISSIAGAVLYFFMPWSIASVLWNSALCQLAMVALLALSGTTLFSQKSLPVKSVLFVAFFSSASLIYETVWGGWIPLILMKLALDDSDSRKETAIITGFSILAQAALIVNYLPSVGINARVMSGGSLSLGYKIELFFENIFVRFPFEVLSSMGLLGGVALPFVGYVAFWLFKNREKFYSKSILYVGLACLAGIVGGILVVTLGNYRITATTDDARFLAITSMWITLLIAMSANVVLSYGTFYVRVACYFLYGLVIVSFFVRASTWVEGFFFQRTVLENVPMERIVSFLHVNKDNNEKRSGEQVKEPPVILMVLNSPAGIFHGMNNTRGAGAVANMIENFVGVRPLIIPTNDRVWRTVFTGSRIYQQNCASPQERINETATRSFVYWDVLTNNVQKIDAHFNRGCERSIHRYEALYELLYPIMANPRRW